ncbi:hypothetical protein [Aliivibrio sp. EL58]|uniref:hypothetical protein n=1 Tax=Aliivibrio sp. EL58 TaxID=2107582 RepID=UPI000EFB4497|nr:hypothetical protein [Aliivibrio sp. EL58]
MGNPDIDKKQEENSKNVEEVTIDSNEYKTLLETQLWERTKQRVWTLIGAILIIVSILGYLGLNTYIDAKIAKQTEKAQESFKKETERTLFYSKSLALLNAQYTVALSEFRKDIAHIQNVSEQNHRMAFLLSQEKGTPVSSHDVLSMKLQLLLRQLIVRTDFTPIIAQKIDPVSLIDGNKHSPFGGRKDVIIEVYKSNGSSYQLSAHPILNGSLVGSILDIKYRIVVLHALSKTYGEFESEFLGGSHNPSVPFYGASDFYQLELEKRYKKYAMSIAEGYLSKSELTDFKEHFDLYSASYFGI